MTSRRALIVDDEADIRALLEITLSRMGLETVTAGSLREATQALASGPFALCLTDMRLPDGLGIELVQSIQREHPELPVAVITAYGNAEDAVTSLKSGAFDFVTKPVSIDTLRRLVESALKTGHAAPEASADNGQLTGSTPAITELRRLIAKLARNQAPVHIHGESGTGKELVARMIHDQGARAGRAFVPVNCGAIPDELMESEFFGHVKGSFTGAVADRSGLFQAAEGGTLFLDEVGDLPLHMQVKLLRAIQERRVRPVGSSHELPVDARIISATHRNLRELIAQGRFREDLYYRLNVIEVSVPPLRQRRQDIPLLAAQILARIGAQQHAAPDQISAAALDALCAYDFPGNIRELENIIERAAALADSATIQAQDLQLPENGNAAEEPALAEPASIDELLEQAERERIVAALEKTRYNKTRAAELLGISFRSLRYRLKKLRIE